MDGNEYAFRNLLDYLDNRLGPVETSKVNGYIKINGVEYLVYNDSVIAGNQHSHENKPDLDRMSIINGDLYIDGALYLSDVGQRLSIVDGNLYIDGELYLPEALKRITIVNDEIYLDGAKYETHTHVNKLELDRLGIANGNLTIDGVELVFESTNNLILENRTSDPGFPVVGQIWLRTDL